MACWIEKYQLIRKILWIVDFFNGFATSFRSDEAKYLPQMLKGEIEDRIYRRKQLSPTQPATLAAKKQ